MKKTNILLLIALQISILTAAQTVKFGAPETLEQKRTSALAKTLGVMNGNYLVVENDYGPVVDMKKNVRTTVRKKSVSNLAGKTSVYLNSIVGKGAGDDKVIFNSIFNWQNRIIGFYSIIGKSNREEFPIYARFFDGDLKPIGNEDVFLGSFYPCCINESFKLTLTVDGKNPVLFNEPFTFSISPDSLKLLLFSQSPEKNNNSVKFTIFDKDLKQLSEFKASIPLPGRDGEVLALRVSNNGTAYLLMKNLKTKAQKREDKDEDDYTIDLYSINPATGKVNTKSIYILGKSIRKPNLTIDGSGNPIVICTFSDDIKDLVTVDGIYTLKLDPVSLTQISSDQHRFSDEMKLFDATEKEIKKGFGMLAVFMDKFIHRPDGGMYAIGRYKGRNSVRYGTVGDNNSVIYDVYRTTIFCFIDPSGKIRWSNALKTFSANYPESTPVNGAVLFLHDNKAFVGYAFDSGEKKKDKIRGFQFDSYDDNGIKTVGKFLPFPDELQEFQIIAPTFAKVNEGEYMIYLHVGAEESNQRKVHEAAVAKIKF